MMISAVLILVLVSQSALGLRFIVIGDWGTGDDMQRSVARAMSSAAGSTPIDFIISTGDNFYPDGVSSPDDSQFEDNWRSMYDLDYIRSLTWYISVGNHDHTYDDGRERHQITYGETQPRWFFPSLAFNFTMDVGGGSKAVFVSYDTQTLRRQKVENDPNGIIDLVRRVMEDNAGASTWRFAFGHHPAYSCGKRDGSSTIRNYIVPILNENNADVHWTGHEHNMQHLRNRGSSSNVDHVISGGGGRGLYAYDETACTSMSEDYDVESLHFSETHGFCVVDLTATSMTVSYRNSDNQEFYSFTRTK